MTRDFEQHSEFMALAEQAFANNSYAPNQEALLAAAKNLARLQILSSQANKGAVSDNFDEVLKRWADV